MTTSINITIADDHPLVINGIKNMLQDQEHIRINRAYATGTALLEGLEAGLPDILMLDIQLPDIGGNELAKKLIHRFPSLRILVLTSMDSLFYIMDMMQAGCKGYLLKSAGKEIMQEAIEQVYRDKEYLMPSIKERLLQNMLHVPTSRKPVPTLTRREQEILRLIAQGHTSSAIAEQLFVSQRTVENHRFNILQKLGAKNTVSLLNIASDIGLL